MTSLQIRNESDRNRAMGHLAALDLTKPKKLAITEVDRSGEQNKALHAALADIAAQVEHAGKKWDVLIWKRLLTAAWLRESGDHGGRRQRLRRHLRAHQQAHREAVRRVDLLG